ncbi:MAG TPA: MFS transporter, partial [Anaerolineales bacterium]
MWQLLRRQPHFRRLFGATLVSEVGNKIHRIALLVLVYEMTSEALWVSLALGVQLLTSVALGPLLSAWADAQERRRLMVLADLLRVPLVIMIPLLGMKSLAALMILIFAVELLRNLHDPVAAAVVPDLVPEADLDNANGLIMFAQRIAEVAFVGLAGLLVALVGAAPAFYIDGATFLLSALIVKGLPQLDPGAGSESAYWARVGEGLRHLVENPPVRRTVLTLAAAAMFGSVEAVLGVVLA